MKQDSPINRHSQEACRSLGRDTAPGFFLLGRRLMVRAGAAMASAPPALSEMRGVLAVKALLWISPKNHPDYARGPRAVGRERVSLEVHF